MCIVLKGVEETKGLNVLKGRWELERKKSYGGTQEGELLHVPGLVGLAKLPIGDDLYGKGHR